MSAPMKMSSMDDDVPTYTEEDFAMVAEEYEEALADAAEVAADPDPWVDPPDWVVEMADREGTTRELTLDDGREVVFFRNRFTQYLRVADGASTLELVYFDHEGKSDEELAAKVAWMTMLA